MPSPPMNDPTHDQNSAEWKLSGASGAAGAGAYSAQGPALHPVQNDWITQLDTGKELLEELGSLGYLLDVLGNDHSSPWTALKWLLRVQWAFPYVLVPLPLSGASQGRKELPRIAIQKASRG